MIISGQAPTREEAEREVMKVMFCYNGIKDGGEEGVDCGGICDKC